MTTLFFYKYLTNIELIKKINDNFKIDDGYIFAKKYDEKSNILILGEDSELKTTKIDGKIVTFNMKLKDILDKINSIEECRITNNYCNYTVENISVNQSDGKICDAYIIYKNYLYIR